jgi:hypothetical protein
MTEEVPFNFQSSNESFRQKNAGLWLQAKMCGACRGSSIPLEQCLVLIWGTVSVVTSFIYLLKRDVFFPLVIRNDAVFVLTLLLN